MATVRITRGFEADLDMVLSEKVLRDILKTVAMLETIPTMGSADVPESIQQTFGDGVRKIPVSPFDIVTRCDMNGDVVDVLGLVHQRAAF